MAFLAYPMRFDSLSGYFKTQGSGLVIQLFFYAVRLDFFNVTTFVANKKLHWVGAVEVMASNKGII